MYTYTNITYYVSLL